jgi:hypothetical protein
MSGKPFWSKVNAAMREIDSSSIMFVLGHTKASRWCCTTCSAAQGQALWDEYAADERAKAEESGNDFDEGLYDDAMFIFYHDQDHNRGATDVYLGWSGQDTPSIVQHFFRKHGLEVVLPPDEHTKILIKEPSLVGAA